MASKPIRLNHPELVEKYSKIKSLAENEFPSDEYYIQITNWTDNDFQICAFHNRVGVEGWVWSCKIRISSEKARNPSNPYRHVTYQKDSNKKEHIIWTDLQNNE